MAIHRNRLAEDVGAAAVFPTPQTVAQNCRTGTAALVIGGHQRPAECRVNSQGFKELQGYVVALHVPRFSACGELKRQRP